MQSYQLQHLAKSIAAITSLPQVVLCGLASIVRIVAKPSLYLRTRLEDLDELEVLVFDSNDAEGCVQLITHTLGRGTFFHKKYGYCAHAKLSWSMNLPDKWINRLRRISTSMKAGPELLTLSPMDFVLDNLLNEPDHLINMELVVNEYVKFYELNTLIDVWDLKPEQMWKVKTRVAALAHQRALIPIEESLTARPFGVAPKHTENIIPIFGRQKRWEGDPENPM